MKTACREVLGGFLEEVFGTSKEENTRFQDSLVTMRYRFSPGTCIYSCMYMAYVHVCMGTYPSHGLLSPGMCPRPQLPKVVVSQAAGTVTEKRATLARKRKEEQLRAEERSLSRGS